MAKKKKKKNNIVAEVGLDGTITKLDGKSSKSNLIAEVGLDGTISKYDIAPVKKKKKEEEKKKNTWFSTAAFDDGYDFGDVTKTLIGSTQDINENIATGVARIGEGAIDLGAYAVGGVANIFGAKDFANSTKKFISRNLVDENKLGEKMAPNMNPSAGLYTLLNKVVNKGKTDEKSYEEINVNFIVHCTLCIVH